MRPQVGKKDVARVTSALNAVFSSGVSQTLEDVTVGSSPPRDVVLLPHLSDKLETLVLVVVGGALPSRGSARQELDRTTSDTHYSCSWGLIQAFTEGSGSIWREGGPINSQLTSTHWIPQDTESFVCLLGCALFRRRWAFLLLFVHELISVASKFYT